MNLDQEDKKPVDADKAPEKKKLSRKEKKALQKVEKSTQTPSGAPTAKSAAAPAPETSQPPIIKENAQPEHEEVEAKLDPSPVHEIPPPKYTMWEKISPPARRKRQISNMESGFREVLGLVHSMRNNQEVLLEAFKKLPEAVESVKKLADHSAQQSDLLKAMNDQIGTGSAGEFNKTLHSMDQTTQLLLERAQRSEEQLYSMLRRAQRRIAFMTLMVLLLFLGAVAAGMAIFFPEKTRGFLDSFDSKQSVEVLNTETSIQEPAAAEENDQEETVTPTDPEAAEESDEEQTVKPTEPEAEEF